MVPRRALLVPRYRRFWLLFSLNILKKGPLATSPVPIRCWRRYVDDTAVIIGAIPVNNGRDILANETS